MRSLTTTASGKVCTVKQHGKERVFSWETERPIIKRGVLWAGRDDEAVAAYLYGKASIGHSMSLRGSCSTCQQINGRRGLRKH